MSCFYGCKEKLSLSIKFNLFHQIKNPIYIKVNLKEKIYITSDCMTPYTMDIWWGKKAFKLFQLINKEYDLYQSEFLKWKILPPSV